MSVLTARPTPGGRKGRADHGISAPFGRSPQYFGGTRVHHGQDYYWLNADPAGSRKVYAAGSGTVTKVAYDSTMGQCITIDHGSFLTRSCHMPRGSAAVKVGQRVTVNTYLGPMGNAGTAANGQYHLHFEVWKGGTRVDPEPYFRAPLGPNQREAVTPAGANVRSGPATSHPVTTVLTGGTIVTMQGYVHGGTAAGSDLWFKHSRGYSHASGFTDRGTHDLKDLTPPVTPPVEEAEPPEEPPVEEPDQPSQPPVESDVPDEPVKEEKPPVTEKPPAKPERWTVGQALISLGVVIAGAITYVIGIIAGWWQ